MYRFQTAILIIRIRYCKNISRLHEKSAAIDIKMRSLPMNLHEQIGGNRFEQKNIGNYV